jgi:alanine racemase
MAGRQRKNRGALKNSAFIEISLDNLLHNLAGLRSRLPRGAGILAVVKDNAYGCGSRFVARTLERRGGVGFFAVRSSAEARHLRKHGLRSPVLVLGPAERKDLVKGRGSGLVFTLNDMADIDLWKSSGVPVRFHCNIDTRMHRMGVLPSDLPALADAVQRERALRLEGVFTHLANADVPGTPAVSEQLGMFNEALGLLRKHGVAPRHVHYANSAWIMRSPELAGATLARPGIALYGCRPDPKQTFPLDLRPLLSLKSSVVKMKKVPAGTPVSYGGRYVTHKETFIATIALGYGDGLPRSLGNRGDVLVGGRRYRIAGTVTMDYIMVDAGPVPAMRVGDEAVAIGIQGSERISPDDVALLDNTIAYEIMCGLSASIDRVYISKGKIIAREKGRNF